MYQEDEPDDPRIRELMERAGPGLDAALQDIGVYAQRMGFGLDPTGSGVVLVIEGLLGDLAFSPRVLDPEVDAALEEIEAGLVDDEVSRNIDELLGGLHGDDDHLRQGGERDLGRPQQSRDVPPDEGTNAA
jgi:hypothetical protein